ncbi:PepSY-associated TM helix domain-containing protein [Vibrio tapetis subsp. quintayensis]|uniref:PepSY-associated TM helix domain-containing protein n=1 Tax=Vibrio tapetis TaxID=52443 RepID=UPI0025B4B416|nr:PepSY-associated TM helix domain-containing protein [Vibrio tapetis]MDN3679724.1 PepSY-associated TM helix domain-containing protein [Vibrio tapetis subsp. quintayensis]
MLKNKSVQLWSRRLHVYISMALLLVVLFFAVTGITLNRPHLYVKNTPDLQTITLSIPSELFHSQAGQYVPNEAPLVEYLRKEAALSGQASALSVFTEIEDGELVAGEIAVDYKGPGYNAAVFIDMESMTAEVETTNYGLIAMLNDLHKGRNSGEIWRWFIDITAALMVVFVLTGVCLLIPKKRTLATSLKWFALGSSISLALIIFAVP